MQKYNEVPWWWYMLLLVLAFFAGLISVLRGETSLPVWAYIVALISGAIITPFSMLFAARVGNGVPSGQLFKMIAGAINPGKPVANLYFSMWSHDVVWTSLNLARDLKLGQYLKVPPRVMFLSQIWGTIIVVMVSITGSQRKLLLETNGNNVWSGVNIQLFNSEAITWSLARQLYGPSGPYFVIPLGTSIGFGTTFLHWLVFKRWPHIGPIRVDDILLPVVYTFSASLFAGVNSVVLSSFLVRMVSQLWLRRYHPGWFRKYNSILGGALDGGAQLMVLILSFAVFGASGVPRPFPPWAGNPANGNVDYCNGNGALDPTG